MGKDKARIDEILLKSENKIAPILMEFQNGDIISKEETNMSYSQALDKKNKDKKLAVVTTEKNVYRGYVDEGYPVDLINTYIAIRNKTTNKVRFVQIEQASMKNHIYDKIESKIGDLLAEKGSNLLLKEFGGRKAKRYLERTERMKVNIDIVQSQLEKTIDEINLDDIEELRNINNLNEICPPFNKDANKVSDVFKLNDIIPQELLDRLNEEANAVVTTKIDILPIISDYILRKIEVIQKSDDPKSLENLNTIKAFIYLDSLLTLIKLKQRNMDRANLSNITEKVETDIRKRFSQPGTVSTIKTAYTRNKAICYFLALALLTADNYEIDLNILSQELSIPRVSIVKYANFVCAKPKYKSDFLTLILPKNVKNLPNPKMRKRKRM